MPYWDDRFLSNSPFRELGRQPIGFAHRVKGLSPSARLGVRGAASLPLCGWEVGSIGRVGNIPDGSFISREHIGKMEI